MIESVSRTPTINSSASELRIVLGQLIRRLRAENTFPISQATVLARLDRQGPQTTSALAGFEHMRPQSMAHTISELETAALIARRPDPLDGRRILIELTEEGRRMLANDRKRREGWLAHVIVSELSPEEQAILIEAVPLLRRLAQS
jgi:DNA-binding MarR family transcriptional regulator